MQVCYSYCPVIHAGNVDVSLGWIRDELQRRGARLGYFRSISGTNFYPHYTHSLDNLFRFGGCAPAIHVQADLRETRLLGLQWLNEGAGLLVRADDDIHRVSDLRGQRIGLSRSLNRVKCDWWRATEERGIELVLALHGMTWNDVVAVDYSYADDWYDRPELLAPVESASEDWRSSMRRRGMGFRSLETALAAGQIDACFAAEPFGAAVGGRGQFKFIERLSVQADWTLHVGNCPYTVTCTSDFADRNPDLVVTFLKGLIRVGNFCNAHRSAAAALLDRSALHHDTAETGLPIPDAIDFVPQLDTRCLKAVDMQKNWMLARGYIEHDFSVSDWAAPEFAAAAERELIEESFAVTPVEVPPPDPGSLEAAQREIAAGGHSTTRT